VRKNKEIKIYGSMHDRNIAFSEFIREIGSCFAISELGDDFIKAWYKQ
jgi:hypothetical protein